MKNALFFTIAFLFIGSLSYGQETGKGLIYTSPLSFNTAFTGYTGASRLTSSYTNTAPEFRTSTQEMKVAYDHYINSLKVGLGLQLSHQNGLNSAYDGYVSYNTVGMLFSKKLIERRNFTILLGTGVRYYEREFDENSVVLYGSTIRGFIHSERNYEFKRSRGVAISPGILFTTNKLIGGISFRNLNQPDISIVEKEKEGLLRTYDFHVAYQFFDENSKFRISPDVIYSHQALQSSKIIFGTHFKYKWAKAGVRLDPISNNRDALFATYYGYQGKRWAVSLVNALEYDRYLYEINVAYTFKRKNSKRQLKLPEIIAF